MTLTLTELEELQGEAMAEDIPINYDVMSAWTREEVATYFESGGEQRPGKAAAAAALSGLHTFSGKLIDGSNLSMASLVGKPVIMVNVASR